MTKKEIEIKVEEVLSSCGISSVPVPIEEVARRENILLKRTGSNDFSGVLLRKSGVSFIALNSKESSVRQRFTLAHELGHYFLHPSKNTFIEFRDNKKNIVRGAKEVEANKFAAALLMPRKLIQQDIASFAATEISSEHITFLAKRYQVSEEAMTYRLMNLVV